MDGWVGRNYMYNMRALGVGAGRGVFGIVILGKGGYTALFHEAKKRVDLWLKNLVAVLVHSVLYKKQKGIASDLICTFSLAPKSGNKGNIVRYRPSPTKHNI